MRIEPVSEFGMNSVSMPRSLTHSSAMTPAMPPTMPMMLRLARALTAGRRTISDAKNATTRQSPITAPAIGDSSRAPRRR